MGSLIIAVLFPVKYQYGRWNMKVQRYTFVVVKRNSRVMRTSVIRVVEVKRKYFFRKIGFVIVTEL